MSSWIPAVEGVILATVPVVGLAYTYMVNRRAQCERILTLTDQATTPPIGDDRHLIGCVFEPVSMRTLDKPVELDDAKIKALFNVLWYFGRADAVYRSLRPMLWPNRITRLRAILLDTLAADISSWTEYLSLSLTDSQGREIDTEDSARGLHRLANQYARLSARRSRPELTAQLAK